MPRTLLMFLRVVLLLGLGLLPLRGTRISAFMHATLSLTLTQSAK